MVSCLALGCGLGLGCGSSESPGDPSGADAGSETAALADARAGDDTAATSGDTAPDAPVRVVGSCAGLGAVDAWEDITPKGVDRTHGLGVLTITSDPLHAGTILIGTDNQGVWKSTDCGSTWSKINTGKNGEKLDTGSTWTVMIDPFDSNVIYAASLYGPDPSLQKSTNGGVDWESLSPPDSLVATHVEFNFFQALSIDPDDHLHLVVSYHADCKPPYAKMCLGDSHDGGLTWRLFNGPRDSWGERAGPMILGPKTFLYHTWGDGFFYTGDDGATWEKVGPGSNFQSYRAGDGYRYLGTAFGMHRSLDGHVWTKVDKAPQGDALIGDGTRVFTAWGDSAPQYATAPDSAPTTWTTFAGPVASSTHRVTGFAYDPDHKLLYSVNTNDGLFRMVTKK